MPAIADNTLYLRSASKLYCVLLWRSEFSVAAGILLQHGSILSKEDQQHILRISNNDQELLDELMAIQEE